MRGKAPEIRSSDSLILMVVHELKVRIAQREKDISRAAITDLYNHGRLQGGLDGLDESLSVIEDILMGKDKEES